MSISRSAIWTSLFPACLFLATCLSNPASATTYTESFSVAGSTASNDGDNFGVNYPGWTYHEVSATSASATIGSGALQMSTTSGNNFFYSVLSASTITGQSTFDVSGGPLTVSASVTGSGGTAGSYNVGVLIGQVAAIFHPGFAGPPAGAGRLNSLTTVGGIIPNQDLGFTPAQGTAYTVSLSIANDPGNVNNYLVDFSVGSYDYSVVNSGPLSIAKATFGSLDQVGFRMNGAATGTFDDLLVTYTPVPEPTGLLLFLAGSVLLLRRRQK